MKTTFLFLILGLTAYGQMYQRTGKNIGLTLGAQYSFLQNDQSVTGLGGSVGLIHMMKPGIYLKSGYSYSKNNQSEYFRPELAAPAVHQSVDASILIDKRILKLSHGRPIASAYGCHYFSIGLIAAPEYHYDIYARSTNNATPHEISGLIGFSFCHIYKSKGRQNMSKTTQFDLFYRQGFTPYYTNALTGQEFKRAELGLQIRRIRHQVSNVLR